jgi:hypothetical protein
MLMINHIYEFLAYCTSMVARDSNGLVMHFRTQDFRPAELLKKATFMAEFYKGGN